MKNVLHRKPVEQLLERLFLSLDTESGAKHLRQLCLSELIDFRRMHSSLQFSAGGGGGVKVMVLADGNGLVTAPLIQHSRRSVLHKLS